MSKRIDIKMELLSVRDFFVLMLCDYLKMAIVFGIAYLTAMTFSLLPLLDVSPIVDALSNYSLIVMIVLLMAAGTLRIAQTLLREVFPRESSQIDGHIDIQVASMNACKSLRVQALRINTALFRSDFVQALESIESVSLLFLRPFEDPQSDWEKEHNIKLEVTMKKLVGDIIPRSAKKNNKITVRYVSEVPSKNTFIYDDKVAHIKNYNKKSNSCESSPINVYSIERDARSFAKILQRFATDSSSTIDGIEHYRQCWE